MSDIIVSAYVRKIMASAKQDDAASVRLLLEEYGQRLIAEKAKEFQDAITALNSVKLPDELKLGHFQP